MLKIVWFVTLSLKKIMFQEKKHPLMFQKQKLNEYFNFFLSSLMINRTCLTYIIFWRPTILEKKFKRSEQLRELPESFRTIYLNWYIENNILENYKIKSPKKFLLASWVITSSMWRKIILRQKRLETLKLKSGMNVSIFSFS